MVPDTPDFGKVEKIEQFRNVRRELQEKISKLENLEKDLSDLKTQLELAESDIENLQSELSKSENQLSQAINTIRSLGGSEDSLKTFTGESCCPGCGNKNGNDVRFLSEDDFVHSKIEGHALLVPIKASKCVKCGQKWIDLL